MKIALVFMIAAITFSASSSFDLGSLDEIWNHFHILTFLLLPTHPEVHSKKWLLPPFVRKSKILLFSLFWFSNIDKPIEEKGCPRGSQALPKYSRPPSQGNHNINKLKQQRCQCCNLQRQIIIFTKRKNGQDYKLSWYKGQSSSADKGTSHRTC